MALKSLQCGKNQALDKITEGQNAFKKKLNGGLDALDSLAAEADKQLGFLEDELKSQLPTPESLQEKLADLGSANPLEIEGKVKDIKEKFGDVIGDIDSFISASIVNPVAKAAAGLAHNIDSALGFLEEDSFDICKNVPNLELDADGNVIEKAAVAKIANGKNTEAKAVEKTVNDKNKDSSTSGSGVSREEFVEANQRIIKSWSTFLGTSSRYTESYNNLYHIPALKALSDLNKSSRKESRIVRKAGFGKSVGKYVKNTINPDPSVVAFYNKGKALTKIQRFHKNALADLTVLLLNLEALASKNKITDKELNENGNPKIYDYARLVKFYSEKGDDGLIVIEFAKKVVSHIEEFKNDYILTGKYRQLEQE